MPACRDALQGALAGRAFRSAQACPAFQYRGAITTRCSEHGRESPQDRRAAGQQVLGLFHSKLNSVQGGDPSDLSRVLRLSRLARLTFPDMEHPMPGTSGTVETRQLGNAVELARVGPHAVILPQAARCQPGAQHGAIPFFFRINPSASVAGSECDRKWETHAVNMRTAFPMPLH